MADDEAGGDSLISILFQYNSEATRSGSKQPNNTRHLHLFKHKTFPNAKRILPRINNIETHRKRHRHRHRANILLFLGALLLEHRIASHHPTIV